MTRPQRTVENNFVFYVASDMKDPHPDSSFLDFREIHVHVTIQSVRYNTQKICPGPPVLTQWHILCERFKVWSVPILALQLTVFAAVNVYRNIMILVLHNMTCISNGLY